MCSEFAPCQKRMSWGHKLKERGIVGIFAWFQCFVCFERPSCFGHTHTCIGSVFGLFHKSVCFGVIGLVLATSRPLLVCYCRKLGILIPVLALCLICLLFSLFAFNRQVYYTDRAYNYAIVRIERIDNPPVNMRSLMRCNFGIDSSI